MDLLWCSTAVYLEMFEGPCSANQIKSCDMWQMVCGGGRLEVGVHLSPADFPFGKIEQIGQSLTEWTERTERQIAQMAQMNKMKTFQ